MTRIGAQVFELKMVQKINLRSKNEKGNLRQEGIEPSTFCLGNKHSIH
jgi:hypothetical protein